MRPYKLLIISGIAKGEIKANSLCFILIKFFDSISYGRVFNYLFENYNFLPKILHTDYEKALKKAIYENIYFKNITYNSHCFFHFAQMIRRKLISSGLASWKIKQIKCRNFEKCWSFMLHWN